MKKKKDFIALIILLTAGYFVSNVVNHPDYPIPFPPKGLVMPLMIVILTSYQFFLYRVTANYVSNRKLRILYGTVLVAQVILGGMAARPDVGIRDVMTVAGVAYALEFASMAIVFTVIVYDMFANKHDINHSLLAATNAFLILPVMFGFVFSFVALFNPTLLGPNVSDLQMLINKSFEISHFIAAGMDPPDAIGSTLFKNIGVFEAFIVNLYIVFVVGKLMIDASAKMAART
jgi:hypothetical protein